MANSVVTTLLHDGQRNVVYSIAGTLDTSDYSAADFTNISLLTPVPTLLRLDHCFFSIEDLLSVQLYWKATSDVLIFPLEGRGKFDFDWFGGYTNTKAAGYTGNVRIATTGWATLKHFALVVEFSKQFS